MSRSGPAPWHRIVGDDISPACSPSMTMHEFSRVEWPASPILIPKNRRRRNTGLRAPLPKLRRYPLTRSGSSSYELPQHATTDRRESRSADGYSFGDTRPSADPTVLAPRVGIEPTTNGLTVRRSTAELPGNGWGRTPAQKRARFFKNRLPPSRDQVPDLRTGWARALPIRSSAFSSVCMLTAKDSRRCPGAPNPEPGTPATSASFRMNSPKALSS